jgi:hypothetical protein
MKSAHQGMRHDASDPMNWERLADGNPEGEAQVSLRRSCALVPQVQGAIIALLIGRHNGHSPRLWVLSHGHIQKASGEGGLRDRPGWNHDEISLLPARCRLVDEGCDDSAARYRCPGDGDLATR